MSEFTSGILFLFAQYYYFCVMNLKKGIKIGFLSLAGLFLAVLLTLQIILNEKLLTRIVNKVAAEYVDGNLVFSRVHASVIKSFPHLDVSLDSCSLTYPHEKFSAYDVPAESGKRFSLINAGRGESVDTLASFRRLELALNYVSLIKGGQINIRKLNLEKPRIFAHYYDSTAANWDILPLGSDDENDTSKSPLPDILLHKIKLSDRPFIVFTDPVDTLHAMITMRRMELDGKVHTSEPEHVRGAFSIDTLFVSGRLPKDTLALGLDHLYLNGGDRAFKLDAKAKAFLATNSFGRLKVPIGIQADGTLPEREDKALELDLGRLGLDVSALHVDGKGNVVVFPDRKAILADIKVDRCPLGEIFREYERNLSFFQKIKTDAVLSLDAHVEGDYSEGRFPAVNAHLSIPESTLDYQGLPRLGRLALEADAVTDEAMVIDLDLKRFLFDIVGARADLKGKVEDVSGEDPLISLDGTIRARIDSLTRAFTSERGISGTGSLKANLHGKAKLSQLDMVNIGNANIQCDLVADNLSINDAPDSVKAYVRRADISLESAANKIDKNIRQGARVLRLKAKLDTLDLTYKENIFARGGDILLLAQNSADILKGGKGLTPLMGLLKIDRMRLKDTDGLGVGLRGNTETFRISPVTKQNKTPKLTLRSDSKGLFLRQNSNAYALRNFKFDVSASKHLTSTRNSERRRRMLDSLQRVYPGVPRDSLFRKMFSERAKRVSTDAFAGHDVDISLSRSLSRYVREWDINGRLDLEKCRIMMPSLPLKTYVKDARGAFDNDKIELENISLTAGESDISANATLSGLRRALIRRGILNLDAKVTSNYLDANQLMRAYAFYSTYEEDKSLEEKSDDELQKQAELGELPDSTASKLIVIPSNLNVNLTLEASGIKYDSLLVSWAAADIAMRQRTLQITNALAASNMGDIYFEGFYSTRNPEDLKAGFDLNLVDITAEKVITLFPAVDTIMPMLKSFAGDLDCELAATTDIDSEMNVVLPTVDGIMKISGKDLSLAGDSQEFKKIAKYLLFKNKEEAKIDKMSVTGMVRDNILEVFPFVLDVDRYLLAASGTQHLDSSFKYHISVIKSPLLLKFGINAWGPDFQHVKFGLGKAKYKSANVPVFTKQLDTVQYSLLSSIHNIFEIGVEKAIAENRQQQVLENRIDEVHLHSEEADTAGLAKIVLDTLERSESFTGDIEEKVASKREQLKKEVLTLAEKASSEMEKKDE